jgi:prefoldin subunit 5
MASRQAAGEDLAARVVAIEDELARLRAVMAALTRQLGVGEFDELIEELADRPMSEEKMEATFARLDAALDSAR